MWPPRSFASRNSLPPEGAAAPAVWQSQSRGPCSVEEAPRLLTACSALPPEGAAAPAVWQSQSRGPCSNGAILSYSLSLRERVGVRARRFRSTPPRLLTACSALPPRGGRCACGPAKPVPRPLLEWGDSFLLPLPPGEGWGEGSALPINAPTVAHCVLLPLPPGEGGVRGSPLCSFPFRGKVGMGAFEQAPRGPCGRRSCQRFSAKGGSAAGGLNPHLRPMGEGVMQGSRISAFSCQRKRKAQPACQLLAIP